MDIVLIATTILSSAGLFGFVQFLIGRHDAKGRELKKIQHQLKAILNKCQKNELSITWLQLVLLIETQPYNKETILRVAQRYFVELGGDGEGWAVFYDWAESNQINTDWYQMLIKKERSKNGTSEKA